MLVTVGDLINYTDIGKLSPKATLGAADILAGLQNQLQLHLGRPLEIGTFFEIYRLLEEPTLAFSPFYDIGLEGGYFTSWKNIGLRNSPVISVTSVYTATPGSASVAMEYETDYGVRRFGIDVWNPVPGNEYGVTYTAGINGVDYPALKILILRAAAREIQNMYDDNKGIQNLETRESVIADVGFTEAELKSVKRLRRMRY